jgi:hypothetical protein
MRLTSGLSATGWSDSQKQALLQGLLSMRALCPRMPSFLNGRKKAAMIVHL